MTTTNINTGVNSLPNRIKFAGCLEIDVNGKYVKDIATPRATAKTIWKAAVKAAKDGVKVDGANDVAICVHLNGLYIGTVFATKEGRKINITPDICQSAVNFLVKGIEEEKQATPTTPETETDTNTETAMTTTDTTDNAPKFEELTHAATNIVLTAKTDGDIYRRYVETLIESLAKKVAKGMQLNISTLASSGVIANIIRESIKGMKSSGWTGPVTASDRKQAAAYLASVYISDAIENAEYINA